MKRKKISQGKLLASYWLHILFIFSMVNFVVVRSVQLRFFAQNCMTGAQIDSDSRCLYTFDGSVYEQGTRLKPHRGKACGMDVTTIIPSSHRNKATKYLAPNIVGALCTGTSVPVSTPTPTPRPTNTPTPTPTIRPQSTPIKTPTPTIGQSNNNQVNTPSKTPTKTPTPTTKPLAAGATRTPTPTQKPGTTPPPTPTDQPPIVVSNGFGFGKYVGSAPQRDESSFPPIAMAQVAMAPILDNLVAGTSEKKINTAVLWSEILVGISFVLLITVSVVGVVKKFWGIPPRKRG